MIDPQTNQDKMTDKQKQFIRDLMALMKKHDVGFDMEDFSTEWDSCDPRLVAYFKSGGYDSIDLGKWIDSSKYVVD